MLDGATCKPRWTRRIHTMDQQVDAFSVGPDINGDGHRDLFVAALWGRPVELYVEALSGATGEQLWLAHRDHLTRSRDEPEIYLWPTVPWWSGGGQEQLLVTVQIEVSTRGELW